MKNKSGNQESSEGNVNLVHGQKVVLLGSCFSDNLAPKFSNAGFEAISNPLGTIFHPLALAQAIQSSLNSNRDFKIFQRDDLWFDWRASGTLYGMSQEEMQNNINQALENLKEGLISARLLVVTMGTAWGYFLENGEIVANCHKMPADTFNKRMSSLRELIQVWKEVLSLLKTHNPNLKIVFTVSPVQHVKDGLIGNSRSKARLVEFSSHLEEMGSEYFPSYEWVNANLREFHFYEADKLHLNSQAIELLWELAQDYFILPESLALAKWVTQTNFMRKHRDIHPESTAAIEFRKKVEIRIKSISEENPEVYWK